jgi:hypothetical protein
MTQKNADGLDLWLDQASPVPEMPMRAIHSAAMDAFPSAKRSVWQGAAGRFGAIAATVILGIGGFMAVQSYQAHEKAVAADADMFAQALLSETY